MNNLFDLLVVVIGAVSTHYVNIEWILQMILLCLRSCHASSTDVFTLRVMAFKSINVVVSSADRREDGATILY